MTFSNRQVITIKAITLLALFPLISPFFVSACLDYLSIGRYIIAVILIAFNSMVFLFTLTLALGSSRYRLLLCFILAATIIPIHIFSAVSANNFPLLYDFYFLLDARAMAAEALSMYQTLIIEKALSFLPILAFIFCFPRCIANKQMSQFSLGIYIASLILFTVVLQVFNSGAGKGIAYPTVLPSYAGSTFIAQMTQKDIPPRGLPKLNLNEQKHNIVLIIDESIRWDFIDLNQDRGTTPTLMQHQNAIHNFHQSYSYANCSAYTNILIRTMARLGHEAEDAFAKRTLWEAMSQAKYENYLIDAQQDGKNHDYFSQEELSQGQVHVLPAKHYPNDNDVAKLINATLEKTPHKKKFIMVIKKGAHAPYQLRQKANAHFSPIMKTNHITKEPNDLIINSYQSKIYENTELFFQSLTLKNNTLYLYTSDHGQNLEHLNQAKTHCTTQNPTENEGLVPLLLLGSHQSKHPMIVKLKQRKQGSHYLIPFLILSYAGYQAEDLISYLGAPQPPEKLAQYLYGNVMSMTGAGAHRFAQSAP